MSFASQVKEELVSRWDFRACCYKAELAAIIDTIGSLNLSSQGLSLHMATQSARTANRIYRLIHEKMKVQAQIYTRQETRLGKKNSYLIAVHGKEDTEKLLQKVGKEGSLGLNHRIPEQLLQWDCCKHAYLRGVFLASGSISDPMKKTYHLEMITHWPEHAVQICSLLDHHELKPHIVERKGNQVIYLKDSNHISDFLTMIGAINSMLNYENTRVIKETRNSINRTTNCEMANLDRTLEAVMEQKAYLLWLRRQGVFPKLTPALLDAAEARLENGDLTLKELGLKLEISKSALNHRLRKLREIAIEHGWNGVLEWEETEIEDDEENEVEGV